MSGVAAALLGWLLLYTYPVAVVTVLVGSLGVPLPSAIVVLAAGAISADGDADPLVLFGAIFLAAVVGDITCFGLARWGEGVALKRFGQRIGLTEARVASMERHFERWGGLLVLVTRCVLTGLALPTNLVAGASGYSLARFAIYVLVGEAIWTGELLGLGWWYGSNWVALVDYLDDFSTALTGLAAAVVLAYLLLRLLRQKSPKPQLSGQDEQE